MQKTAEHALILTTCPNSEIATQIAHELVTKKLVACINIIPKVRSVYYWQGKVEQDDECLLLIKTTCSMIDEVEQELKRLHPYELPEIVAVPMMAGSEEYLGWMQHTVR